MEKNIKSGLLEGSTLTAADLDLVQTEREEIHAFVPGDVLKKLKSAKERIAEGGTVTPASNEKALMKAVNTSAGFVDPASVKTAEAKLQGPKEAAAIQDPSHGKKLDNTIKNLEAVISVD